MKVQILLVVFFTLLACKNTTSPETSSISSSELESSSSEELSSINEQPGKNSSSEETKPQSSSFENNLSSDKYWSSIQNSSSSGAEMSSSKEIEPQSSSSEKHSSSTSSSSTINMSSEEDSSSSILSSSEEEPTSSSSVQESSSSQASIDVIDSLKAWLDLAPENRPELKSQSFATLHLSKDKANEAKELLHKDFQDQIKREYNDQWKSRRLQYQGLSMPFYYQVFGPKPSDGRSLFISLHGGGGAPAATNDQQYENQKHLYDATMNSLEGVYLAPRAPTNDWDLWHQSHIDEFLNIIIQMAVIKEGVNPNKVYILGYSAGGDGLYQLGPRMADRWAAASMMAGHPNDASPLSLRNIPFGIYMGGDDSAYDRNTIAAEWGDELDRLQASDPEGYIHDVHIFQGYGHWMQLQDAIALPWMHSFERNPLPDRVVWRQDDRKHNSFYWIKMPDGLEENGGEITAEYKAENNEVIVRKNYSEILYLMLNDEMLDLDSPVTVKFKNTLVAKIQSTRTIWNLFLTISYKGDANLSFPTIITLENNNIASDEFVKK